MDLIEILKKILRIGNSPGGRSIDVSTNDFEPGYEFNYYVGTIGDVTVDYQDGEKGVVMKNCADGSYHPNPVTKIHSAGTSASNIVIFKI